MSATSAARNPPGDGPRTTSPRFGIDRGQHRRHRRGRRACPDIARGDDDDEVGGIQRGLGGIGETAGQIAHHGDSPAAAGIDDGVDRPGVQFVAAPGAGQQADAAVPRQRVAHGRPVQAAALQSQVRPTQTRPWSRCPAANRCRRPRGRDRPAARRWRHGPGRRRTTTRRRRRSRRSPRRPRRVTRRRAPIRAASASSRIKFVVPARAGSTHVGRRPRSAAAQVAVEGVGDGQHADVSAARQRRPATSVAAASSSTTAAAADQVFRLTDEPRRHGPPEHRRPPRPGPARRASARSVSTAKTPEEPARFGAGGASHPTTVRAP